VSVGPDQLEPIARDAGRPSHPVRDDGLNARIDLEKVGDHERDASAIRPFRHEGTGVERIVNTRRATDPRLVAIHSAARGRRDVDAHRSDLHRAFSRSGIARPVRSAS
jgi:hypothetical protein